MFPSGEITHKRIVDCFVLLSPLIDINDSQGNCVGVALKFILLNICLTQAHK